MFRSSKKRRSGLVSGHDILGVLDKAAEAYVFPMLDNGYIYPVASRLTLFRSKEDWAVVFETFGFSPRAGHPDLTITTIANRLKDRNKRSDYVSETAHENYLKQNPNWDMRNFWPISNEEWIDENDPERTSMAGSIVLRGRHLSIPEMSDYAQNGVTLAGDFPAVVELCRYIACDHEDDLLATETERRVSVLPDMQQLLQLDEWHHPDLSAGQLPSQTETFKQLAKVLETGSLEHYSKPETPNNHWKNWPEGGTL